ncbi:hypothetical protein AB0I66_34990 [Streptomyces sp. NPDC050439]|uniref:hypothetical protein n=1 Tax=unclassified Streptomyces TaxID=2593676 RepID=UPI00342FFFCE
MACNVDQPPRAGGTTGLVDGGNADIGIAEQLANTGAEDFRRPPGHRIPQYRRPQRRPIEAKAEVCGLAPDGSCCS